MMPDLIGLLTGVNKVSKKFKGNAINNENWTLFLLAYTFGSISPNNKITKVTIPTSIRNLRFTPK